MAGAAPFDIGQSMVGCGTAEPGEAGTRMVSWTAANTRDDGKLCNPTAHMLSHTLAADGSCSASPVGVLRAAKRASHMAGKQRAETRVMEGL